MNKEPQLRCDPVTGRWVLIAPERALRPIALTGSEPRHRVNSEAFPCPFCSGRESETTNEVLAYRDPDTRPNGPGWHLRVVPNMYPAVRAVGCEQWVVDSRYQACDDALDSLPTAHCLLQSAPGFGYAEVLIECPQHIDNPTNLSDAQFANIFRAYRDRMRALASEVQLAHVAVFKNVGAEAGASLGHTHSQIIATPIVPELIRSELSCAEDYFARAGRCVFCDLVQQELADGARVVARSANYVVVTAFAPRFSYEMWVLPTAHESRYETLSDSGASELGILLKQVLRALDVVQNAPAYNWYLHSTPLRLRELLHYHWHLEVLPRTARPAGFEWGHGCHITTIAPEHAAAELRSALKAVAAG